ncbi:MAG: glycoside hydrolase family 57 protein [Chthoniobacteraceae bacterium]
MANVVFLWHMHQPYYVNPTTRVAMMPWVRLHAVKGYLDMITVLADFPGVKVNFNLTPVLMLQIEELTQGRIKDLWLEWSRKPAADLDEEERLGILEHFFKIHHDNLLRPHPRYVELLGKCGPGFYRDRARAELRNWSTAEFRDLQTWYNLGWCGFTAGRLYPELGELKRKGRHFSEEEKLRVLDIHLEILASIPKLYADAEARGQAELTTTPFFHPILPLVYDSDFAERCMPGRPRPKRFHWPQDALAQLQLAVAQHTRMFGRAPRGLWPSEGSIAPELVPLMQQAGIQYFCSDEENLFNSLRRSGVHADHLELFQGWRVEHEGAAVNAVFREKPLSDFIGFMAARNEPHQSAEHLLTHFRHIADQVPRDTGLIPIVLDGENAWETFKDGGEAFLRELYGGLEKSAAQLTSCTIEDYFRRCPPKQTVTTLHTGSWICSDFDIWIGDDEENRAWNLLGETRQFLEGKLHALKPQQKEAALREIYAAEGSDWFWWYGPDFTTQCDVLFDDLFREHLKNVYLLCGETPPPKLDWTLLSAEAIALYTRPTRQLSPQINGSIAPFFEWMGAGRYLAGSEQGSMFRDDRFLRVIRFACDTQRLHLRFELRRWGRFQISVVFHQPPGLIVQTPVLARGRRGTVSVSGHNGEEQEVGDFAADQVVEASIPFSSLGVHQGNLIQFQVKVFEKGIERECYPESAPIELVVPGPETAMANWVV